MTPEPSQDRSVPFGDLPAHRVGGPQRWDGSGRRPRTVLTSTSRLHWRCVACRGENQTVFGARGGGRFRNGGGAVSGPVETACANCRTRHILTLGPGELRHVGPRDEIVRRSGAGALFLPGLGLMMTAAGGALLCLAAGGGAPCAVAAALVGLAGLAALAWIVVRARRSEGFLSGEEGLEVRGPGGHRRALIPWEKIRAAEYRLLLGRRMALWLAVEGPDGTVPAAPLVADTGIALFTRFRAMPQFLLSMAGRLGDRAPFLLPILTVVRDGDGDGDGDGAGPADAASPAAAPCDLTGDARGDARGDATGEAVALAIRSDAAPRLVSGTLDDAEIPRSLAEPGGWRAAPAGSV